MYRKIVWCYAFILTLLDISPNTQLTAQGKSHGIPDHDAFAEKLSLQEFGAEGLEAELVRGAGGVASLRLEPARLRFGAAALGAAHHATVTLVNTANATLHLAAVAGATPDFHASFFEHKSLAAGANTTFSVVFVGRREGWCGALLALHTSLGVHRLPVTAVAVAGHWNVWPLSPLRVPANATLRAPLTLTNPTKQWVQVSEIYASAPWLRLALPGDGAKLPRAAWLLPPLESRPLLDLLVALPTPTAHPPQPPQPPPHLRHMPTLTAYVRIKTNATEEGWAGQSLLLVVEARPAPAGLFAQPLHVRLPARGSRDPPDEWEISVGNSGSLAMSLEASVFARCSAAPAPTPDLLADPADSADGIAAAEAEANGGSDVARPQHSANGGQALGAFVSVSRGAVQPFQPPMPTARFHLDYGKLWESLSRQTADSVGGATGGAGVGGVGGWCGGWVRVGGASVPYSVRLLPGTLSFQPDDLQVVQMSEAASEPREVRVRNEFAQPIRLMRLDVPYELRHVYFHVEELWPEVLAAGASAPLLRLSPRAMPLASRVVDVNVTLHTNVSAYRLPVAVYDAKLHVEWDWVNATESVLDMGAVGVSSTRRVRLRVRNESPRRQCLVVGESTHRELSLALEACAHRPLSDVPEDHPCRCIAPKSWARGLLTVVAPARAGPTRAQLTLATKHVTRHVSVKLDAVEGRVTVPPVNIDYAAPFAWGSAELVVDSTMQLTMQALQLTTAPSAAVDGALDFLLDDGESREVRPGRRTVGVIQYKPENTCASKCYSGLPMDTPEGEAWLSRSQKWGKQSLQADEAAMLERRQWYRDASGERNLSLLLHTDRARHIPVRLTVRLRWPRIVAASRVRVRGQAAATALGASSEMRIAVRNPSRSHSMLLQPAFTPWPYHGISEEDRAHDRDLWDESPHCKSERCVPDTTVYRPGQWSASRGDVRTYTTAATESHFATTLPILVLAPDAEVELTVMFAPKRAALISTYLYLRNNLTVVEAVQLVGRGVQPSFELAGRRPGQDQPILLEVSECGVAGGSVQRSVLVRNTGAVAVRLSEWWVGGGRCKGRGFAVAPCDALLLQPNETQRVMLAFAPDWTLGRATAELQVRTDAGACAFALAATVPAPLLPRCHRAHATAEPEPNARRAALAVGSALLFLVMVAAALDADRVLRRARLQRQPASAPRAPLDLRQLAHAPPTAPPPAPPPAPRPPPVRRRKRRPDPAAESRAFERWRAAMARHDHDQEREHDENDERSSEDADVDEAPATERPPAETRDEHTSRAVEEPPRSSSGEDDARSSDDDSESPEVDDDEPKRPAAKVAATRGARAGPAPPEAASPSPSPSEPPPPAEPPRPRLRPADAPRRDRRSTDADNASRPRSSTAKHHARKDKPKRRERERPTNTPPCSSPPTADARAPPPPMNSNGSGPAAPVVRWGASWSSVVARSGNTSPPAAPAPPPAPVGSGLVVRSPSPPVTTPLRSELAPAPAGNNSLFYFNGDPPSAPAPPPACASLEPDFWRAPQQPERCAFVPPTNEYLNQHTTNEEPTGVFGSIGVPPSQQASAAPWQWQWGAFASPSPAPAPPPAPRQPRQVPAQTLAPTLANLAGLGGLSDLAQHGAVRPPPGFGASPTNGSEAGEAVGGARPFDPFHSLAAIWTPGALDWRDRDDHHHDQ